MSKRKPVKEKDKELIPVARVVTKLWQCNRCGGLVGEGEVLDHLRIQQCRWTNPKMRKELKDA